MSTQKQQPRRARPVRKGNSISRRQMLAVATSTTALFAAVGGRRVFAQDQVRGTGAPSAAAAPELPPAFEPIFANGDRFSVGRLVDRARAMAAKPFVDAKPVQPDVLSRIDYDAAQKIRFRSDATFTLRERSDPTIAPPNSASPQQPSAANAAPGNTAPLPPTATPIQLFHLGKYQQQPVRLSLVSDTGSVRSVPYDPALFDIPDGHPAKELGLDTGYAGFRVMAPDLKRDWLSFLGASYFRTSGPFDQYGLSARGLAIDTGLSTPEEFPRFTDFWIAPSPDASANARRVVVHALLDSPRVTGAYTFEIKRRTDARGVHTIVMDIDAHLFARGDVERLGVAPFSSMFWYGEGSRRKAVDWRPEIHDSDGLAMFTGEGERLYRVLNNPPRVTTSAFADKNPRGFGLLQRDRDFVHYLDDGVFYEKRASVWVEPKGEWGAGAVHLLEIPTDDEIYDNIAAYWCPDAPFRKGEARQYRYRLTWTDVLVMPKDLARVTATHTGVAGRPGQPRPEGVRKYVIDFKGGELQRFKREDKVEIVVTSSRGTVAHAYCHPVVGQQAHWRAFFDIEASGAEPVEMRAYLRHDERALTETWLSQYFPEQQT